jgi:nitrilase
MVTVDTLAVVQAAPVAATDPRFFFDEERTLDKLESLAADAARQGAKLAVFPEAFLGGYPKGLDFGVCMGIRTPEGRELFRRYAAGAITVPGPAVDRLAAIARDQALHLVVGVVERSGGTLYCTTLTLGPSGELLARHRKLMPTAMERLVWGSGDGSTLPVVETPVGRVGSVICWENYMPLLRTAMYAQGIELYCAVTVDDRDTWYPTIRHIALEGRCFVLSACQVLTRSDLPAGYSFERFPADREILIRGGSAIVGPLGQPLAGPVFDQETILVAPFDRDELMRAKFDLDAVGHYARPDIFHLTVDTRPRPPVTLGNPQE